MAPELLGMKQNTAPLDLVRFHVFNRVQSDILNFEILKYCILQRTSVKEYSADVKHYKSEDFTLFANESCTFNVRPRTCGIVNVRYEENADYSDPIMSLAYWWDEYYKRELLKFEIIEKFSDTKSLKVDPLILAPSNNVALVLKGSKMQDSFFYYSRMPEED